MEQHECTCDEILTWGEGGGGGKIREGVTERTRFGFARTTVGKDTGKGPSRKRKSLRENSERMTW